jgi:hypothetical protein
MIFHTYACRKGKGCMGSTLRLNKNNNSTTVFEAGPAQVF